MSNMVEKYIVRSKKKYNAKYECIIHDVTIRNQVFYHVKLKDNDKDEVLISWQIARMLNVSMKHYVAIVTEGFTIGHHHDGDYLYFRTIEGANKCVDILYGILDAAGVAKE